MGINWEFLGECADYILLCGFFLVIGRAWGRSVEKEYIKRQRAEKVMILK